MKLDTNRLRAALAQEKTAIHCDTLEKAEALFEALGWKRRGTYGFKTHGKETCIHSDDTETRPFDFWYGSRNCLKSKGHTILSLDAFILSDEPLMCKALGVRVNREFEIEGHCGMKYRINSQGIRQYRSGGSWMTCTSEEVLNDIINNPHLIHIIPRWTDADIEDAKAVRRLFPDMAWVARDKGGSFWGYKAEPVREKESFMYGDVSMICRGLPQTAFPSVTWDNSPVKLEDIVKEDT